MRASSIPLRVVVLASVLFVAAAAACSDDDVASSSGGNTGGCKEPGTSCSANDECCQKCQCEGSSFPVNFHSCSLTSGAKICMTCADHCGTKKITVSEKCAGC
jgi:hypothetical protein